MKRSELWGGVFWLGLSLYILVKSLELGFGRFGRPGPGFLLFWSALVLGAFSISICIKAVATGNRTNVAPLRVGTGWKKVVAVTALLLLYAVSLPRIGYLLATFLLLLFLLVILERSRIWLSGCSSLLITGLSYLLFSTWLGVELPRGILSFQ